MVPVGRVDAPTRNREHGAHRDTQGEDGPMSGTRRGRPAEAGAPPFLGAAIALLVSLTGCAPAPDDPGEGEITGVVVSRNDHPILFGGGTVDSWSLALVLTRDELLAAYDSTWPGRDEPEDSEVAAIVVEVDEGSAPAEGAAPVVDGRFRLCRPAADRYVCLGNAHQGVVTTAGCVLVESAAPSAITIESSIGGFGIGD